MSELVLVARFERTSGVWNDGASMVVFPGMFESGSVGVAVGQHALMGKKAERRKEARVGVWMRSASRLSRTRGGVRILTHDMGRNGNDTGMERRDEIRA